jgi:hypothetical protein
MGRVFSTRQGDRPFGGIIVRWGEGIPDHVSRTLHGPLVVLFDQQGPDQANNGVVVV